MNSARNFLIMFALVLLLLIVGVILLGNPQGTTSSSAISSIQPILDSNGIAVSDIEQCVEDSIKTEYVENSIAEAKAYGFTGTPGSILYNSKTGLGVYLRGAFPAEILRSAINGLLNEDLPEGVTLYDAGADSQYSLVSSKIENLTIRDDDNYRGNKEAKIQLFEYSDYDCQYCASFHSTVQGLLGEFPNDLVWIYRQFPLSQIHPGSLKKSYTALCVKDKSNMDVFWQVTDFYLQSTLNSQ